MAGGLTAPWWTLSVCITQTYASHSLWPFPNISFAAVEVLNEISILSLSFDPVDSDSTWYRSQHSFFMGFLSFTLAALPDIQARALRILRIRGFRPPEDGYRFRRDGEVATYSCHGHDSDPPRS
jgi:hypothetical protein